MVAKSYAVKSSSFDARMDKYENLGMVGEGSYGMVMKCKNRETGKTVAIKKFLESEEDKMVKKIALREVNMLRRLRHENLVNLIEVFRRRKRLYLVFEFVDHTILDDLEKYPTGLNEVEVQKILWQVLRGVEFIHNHNIIHRDIKPENILHSRGGVIKLCDFGFARTMASPNESYTDYVATRWYRAPELLVGDTKYGRAVDIWAIGCLLVEMLTGDPLFPGDSDIDQLHLIIQTFGNLCPRHKEIFYRNPLFAGMRLPDVRKHQSLESRFFKLSNEALHLSKKCMELEPSDRPTSSLLSTHDFFQRNFFTEKVLPDLRRQIHKENLNNGLIQQQQQRHNINEKNHLNHRDDKRTRRKKLAPKDDAQLITKTNKSPPLVNSSTNIELKPTDTNAKMQQGEDFPAENQKPVDDVAGGVATKPVVAIYSSHKSNKNNSTSTSSLANKKLTAGGYQEKNNNTDKSKDFTTKPSHHHHHHHQQKTNRHYKPHRQQDDSHRIHVDKPYHPHRHQYYYQRSVLPSLVSEGIPSPRESSYATRHLHKSFVTSPPPTNQQQQKSCKPYSSHLDGGGVNFRAQWHPMLMAGHRTADDNRMNTSNVIPPITSYTPEVTSFPSSHANTMKNKKTVVSSSSFSSSNMLMTSSTEKLNRQQKNHNHPTTTKMKKATSSVQFNGESCLVTRSYDKSPLPDASFAQNSSKLNRRNFDQTPKHQPTEHQHLKKQDDLTASRQLEDNFNENSDHIINSSISDWKKKHSSENAKTIPLDENKD